MNNRLGDLKSPDAGVPAQNDMPQNDNVSDAPSKESATLKQFYSDIDEVNKTTVYLKDQAKKIEVLEKRALGAVRTEESKATSSALDALVSETRGKLGVNAKLLSKMKEENESVKRAGNASETRIRSNLYENSVTNFVAAMRLYQAAQRSYKDKMRAKVARQIHLVAPDASEQDIDIAMKSGDPGAIYRNAVLVPGADPIKQAYQEVQSKYNDVRILEESVIALNRMFQDMAMLVEQQGAILDQVEVNVAGAAEYTTKGRENVEGALKARQSSRKKMLIIFALFLIILAIIFFAIQGKVSGSGGLALLIIAIVLVAVAIGLLWFLNPCKTLCSFN
jgi:syntaxin 1B/2/3